MERAELPCAFANFPGLYIPDMIAFGFDLPSIFVESENVLLSPEIVPDLAYMRKRLISTQNTHLLHRNLFFWISLPSELIQVRERHCEVMSSHTHLFEKGIGKGLYPELERSEVLGFVQSLHLLGHQSLMNGLSF